MKSPEIKNILEERSMEVSEQSWEKLSAKLDAHDQNKRKRKLYIPYAACLALLVGWIVFMITRSETVAQDDQFITEKSTKEIQIKNNSEKKIQPQEESKIIKEVQIAVEENSVERQKQLDTKQTIQESAKEMNAELQKEIQQSVVIQEKILPKKIETVINTKEVALASNDDLKDSIAALFEKKKRTVTNAEIDLLLKEAQESLKHLEVKEESVSATHYATADQLLNEVEYELDKSFKHK